MRQTARGENNTQYDTTKVTEFPNRISSKKNFHSDTTTNASLPLLAQLAGSKDQEKVIEFLKSGTPLRRLCTSDGKLEDIKKILDKNSEEIKVSLKLMSTSVIQSSNAQSRRVLECLLF